jgi:superfamily I DNA/RNA helicase
VRKLLRDLEVSSSQLSSNRGSSSSSFVPFSGSSVANVSSAPAASSTSQFLGHDRLIRVVIIGDENQGVYAFNGSDSRFLSQAARLFADAPNVVQRFQTLALRTSYRITSTMADFVSRGMLRRQPDGPMAVRADPSRNRPRGQGQSAQAMASSGPPPVFYYMFRQGEAATHIADSIVKMVCHKKSFAPDDIFVLAPSITESTDTCLRLLENRLVTHGVPCYVQPRDSDHLAQDDTVMKGKVAFLTFASCKGLERRICVVLNFDVGYFNYFARDTVNRHQCPPALYVAATRARDLLYVVAEQFEGEHLPFLDRRWVEGSPSVRVSYASC